jgi:protein TonB
MSTVDETLDPGLDEASVSRAPIALGPRADSVHRRTANIAIATTPDAQRSRQNRWRCWSCAFSLCLHGLALLAVGLTFKFQWQALPVESGTAAIELTASLSDEMPTPDATVQIQVQPPPEPTSQPVATVKVETELAQHPQEVDIVVTKSDLVAPASMPRRKPPQPVQNLQPMPPEAIRRAAVTDVPPISTMEVTMLVASRSATATNTPPRLVYNPSPVYPAAQLAARITGRVVFLAAVDSQGRVVSLTVEQSSGSDALDQAARQAVSRWRFEPTGAVPGPREVRIPINFRILGQG